MTHQDIIAHLSQLQPQQVVHEITTKNLIAAIVRRMGKVAWNYQPHFWNSQLFFKGLLSLIVISYWELS